VTAPIEIWGGVECTVNRVGDWWFDQLAWSNHCARLDDLDRFAELGLRALRYPVLWEHLAPRSLDDIDWRPSDARMRRLADLGLRPIVGLVHHGSGPAYTSLLDEEFPEKLASFAGLVARRYPWVTDYTPVNEPLTTARFSGLYGHWYPHARSDREFVRALINQLRGVVLAMRAVRAVNPAARLVQTEDCGITLGTEAMRDQIAHEQDRRWLTWDLLTGRVTGEHPLWPFLSGAGMTEADRDFFVEPGGAPDLLGLNYYVTSDRYLDERLALYPASTHGGNASMRYADVEAVRAHPEGIVGHTRHLMSAWERYGIPTAITETHMGCTREEQMRWLIEAWRGAERARACGANVPAITVWALLGSFNWDSLVTRDHGHYECGVFDVRGRHPRPTALAPLIRALAAGTEPAHPALAGTPWWRRGRDIEPASAAPPILISGSNTTLGHALHGACEARGLVSRLVGPLDADIAEPAQLDRLVRRYRPWALVVASSEPRGTLTAKVWLDEAKGARTASTLVIHGSATPDPHALVHTALDLLIDGEHGHWNVSHSGTATPADHPRSGVQWAAASTNRSTPGALQPLT